MKIVRRRQRGGTTSNRGERGVFLPLFYTRGNFVRLKVYSTIQYFRKSLVGSLEGLPTSRAENNIAKFARGNTSIDWFLSAAALLNSQALIGLRDKYLLVSAPCCSIVIYLSLCGIVSSRRLYLERFCLIITPLQSYGYGYGQPSIVITSSWLVRVGHPFLLTRSRCSSHCR
jgi:hypothetical protein